MSRAGLTLAALAAFAVSPAAAASSGFPNEFLGRWGETLEGCSPGAVHGGLSIKRLSVADGEFSGSVQSVRRRSDGSIDVKELWDVPEEGPTSFVSNYRLAKNGRSLTVSEIKTAGRDAAEPMILIRCKARHV